MQFSFAFSGKLHRVSISPGNRPRYTKCVSILSSKGSERCSIKAFTSRWQLIYYIRIIFTCQELFQNFFRSFWSISFKTQTFLTATSFETAYLVYQTQNHLSRTFFHSFQIFWTWLPRLSATALIEYHRDSPPVNIIFQFSWKFFWIRKTLRFCLQSA